MEHVIIRHAGNEQDQAIEWSKSTPDGDLLDPDIFAHQSTFLLNALSTWPAAGLTRQHRVAYLPVQQPLFLENLIFRPGLNDRERALAIARMVESSIGEAYRRDAGELYFLCKHKETCAFAERHKFKNLRDVIPGVEFYRLNLKETFGV